MENQLYLKVLDPHDRDISSNHQYQMGLNIAPAYLRDPQFKNVVDNCGKKYGFVFATPDIIHRFYEYGDCLAVVELPIDDPHFKMFGKYCANRIIIKETYQLSDPGTYHRFGIKYPELSVCANHRYFDIIKILVENGEDVAKDGHRALVMAIKKNYKHISTYLIGHGVNIRSNDDEALRIASQKGNLEMVKYLVQMGADIRAGDNGAVVSALCAGHFDVVKYLVGLGADITAQDSEAVKYTFLNGEFEMFKYLVENGANIKIHLEDIMENIFDIDHDYKFTKYLISLGINIFSYNNNIINCAIENNDLEMVNYFIQLGAKIGSNELEYTIRQGHLDLVKYFVQMGTKVTQKTVDVACRMGDLEILQYFISLGIDINLDNMLVKASGAGNLKMIQYLVEMGANVRANNDRPVRVALRYGYFNVVKYLVQMGADIKNNGYDPLNNIITWRLDMVQYLAKLGINLHKDNDYLFQKLCSFDGHLEIVKYLVEMGTDVTVCDNKAIKIAKMHHATVVMEYLLSQGAKITEDECHELEESGALSRSFCDDDSDDSCDGSTLSDTDDKIYCDNGKKLVRYNYTMYKDCSCN